jgi:hypothetical protein
MSDLSTKADQEFFEKARKRSPVFPNVAEILERRRRAQEAFVARFFLYCMFVATPLIAIFYDLGFAGVVGGFSLVGFIATCFVAGNRQFVRNGGDKIRRRPF